MIYRSDDALAKAGALFLWKKGRDDDIVYKETDLYHTIIESGCRMNIREVNENDIEAKYM